MAGMKELHWSDHSHEKSLIADRIPPDRLLEIGNRIREQLIELPVNLFVEFHDPENLREEWFVEAAKYIEIPWFYDYWGDGAD